MCISPLPDLHVHNISTLGEDYRGNLSDGYYYFNILSALSVKSLELLLRKCSKHSFNTRFAEDEEEMSRVGAMKAC